MSFFDKIDNSTIVDTLEQPLNRRDREIFSTDIPQAGSCLTISGRSQNHKIHTLAGRHQIVSVNCECVLKARMTNSESINNTASRRETFLLCVTIPTVE